jgi:MarR family transcriptional regulator, organic hydroperoxide resistance regulator
VKRPAGRSPSVPDVATDIRQKRPFARRGEEATVGLLLTADVVRRFGESLLESSGVTLQQYNVLRILRGSRPDALPTLEIAARMIEQAPGITRLLDRLERKGLIRRQRCPEDRRQVLCSITEKGLAKVDAITAAIRKARQPMNRLSRRDLGRLIEMLDAVRAAHR